MSGLTDLAGAVTDPAATSIAVDLSVTVVPTSRMILVDDEAMIVGSVTSGHYATLTRGAFSSLATTHLDEAVVYDLRHVHSNANGLIFYYVDESTGLLVERFWENPAFVPDLPLPVIGGTPDNYFLRVASSVAGWVSAKLSFTPTAEVAELTDSTTGVAGSTLIAVRSDTVAHTAADCATNFATLYAYAEAIEDARIAMQTAIIAGTVQAV